LINSLLLLLGQLVSQTGDQIYNVALIWWVIKKNGSAEILGVLGTVYIIPSIFIGPFLGAISDRLNKKSIIIFMDFIRGILMIYIGIMALNDLLSNFHLIINTFIIGICSAMFDPTVIACLPNIVHEEKKVFKLQSMMELIRNFVIIFGPICGGIILSMFKPEIAFILNGISFLISAISETFIVFYHQQTKKIKFKEIMLDLKNGIKFIYSNNVLKFLMPIFGLMNMIGLPILQIIIPMLLFKRIGTSISMGAFYSIMGGGGILGSLILSKYNIESKLLVLIGSFMDFISTILLFVISDLYGFIIVGLLYGFSASWTQIGANFIFLREVPIEMRTKVFSFRRMIAQIFIPIGMLAIGTVVEKISMIAAISISIIILGFIFLLLLIGYKKEKYYIYTQD
jgi:MFS family permease